MKFILGLKLGMSQIFDKDGNVVPLTLIEAGPCQITQVKNKKSDGYESLQIGFKEIEKKKKIKKPMQNKPFRFIREFRNPSADRASALSGNVGDKIDVSIFQEGDIVKVAGVSKGKGFQGAVRRWGFHGKKATHGVKHEARTVGSIGSTGLQRVWKGKKMPGRMGGERTTVKNLQVIKVDKENNLLAIRGAVPGHPGTLVEIRA
ncbi:MAG: 50S ribosomal protein L3 [Candidatus Nealsonbacteria bacterium]